MPDIQPRQIALVGPLPPPFGGMANQTEQLAGLLEDSGIRVSLIRSNAPYRPAWTGRIRGIRALFRLLAYLARVWRGVRDVELVHLMANSGWSWHLFAAPVIWLARIRGVPVVVNYRGGEAETFLQDQIRWVRPTLKKVNRLVVPSGFLRAVFERFGMDAEIVPNIIDLERFGGREIQARVGETPHLVVCRNLEPIYDVESAIRAFSMIRERFPGSRLTVAGEGPERERLEQLVETLGLGEAVTFSGRLDRDGMVTLYRSADLMINSSRVDNMPNALLESMSAGVPVVTTDAGGIPYMVSDGDTALIRPVGDTVGLAKAAISLLENPELYREVAENAREEVLRYSWESVKPLWIDLYTDIVAYRTGGNEAKKTN